MITKGQPQLLLITSIKKRVDPERFQLEWISAAEGKEFAAKIKEMDEIVQEYARQIDADVLVEAEPV